MKSPFYASIVLAGFLGTACAQDSSLGQSIMFDNQPQNRSDLTTLPPGTKKKGRGERCTDMLLEIQKLKGKPQRRSTMAERYRQECERP
ncbi:MAG: hypothetical protein KJN79_06480 [Gammaproteobacteria bacterium]|nr:hypothetical protein [Gammaproteobacteria bacterium]